MSKAKEYKTEPQMEDSKRLDWLNTITERKNWLKFWNDFMSIDIRKAIDAAMANNKGRQNE